MHQPSVAVLGLDPVPYIERHELVETELKLVNVSQGATRIPPFVIGISVGYVRVPLSSLYCV